MEALSNNAKASQIMDKQAFRAFLANAQNQTNSMPIIPPGFVEPTAYLAKPAATTGTLNLATSELPVLIGKDGNLTAAPIATPGGETLTMAAAILQASRVAAAGAHIITRPDPSRAIAMGKTGGVALESIARYFNTIEAAPFATIPEADPLAVPPVSGEVSVSTLPVSRAAIDWSNAPQAAVNVEDTRHRTCRHLT